MKEAGVQPLLNAVYVSSEDSERILKSLTKEAGFSAENVISRLAIARSLEDGGFPEIEHLSAGGGKQIRGSTLLGRRELAVSLLAMIAAAQAEPPDADQMKVLVRQHWERGLFLLERDRQASGGVDAMFMDCLERAALPDDEVHVEFDPASMAAMVVGQERLIEELVPYLQSRLTQGEWCGVIGICGPTGAGKTHLAGSTAHALTIPYLEVEVSPGQDAWAAIEKSCREASLSDSDQTLPCVVGIDLSADNAESIRTFLSDHEKLRRMSGGAICLMYQENGEDISVDAQFSLQAYSRDSIAEIVRVAVGGWPLAVRHLLALAGQLNPSLTLERAIEFRRISKGRGTGRANENLLLEVMTSEWGLDRLGLSSADYAALRKIQSGASPERTDRLRFIEQLNLIRFQGEGVELTPRGSEALSASGGA